VAEFWQTKRLASAVAADVPVMKANEATKTNFLSEN
jgi:hypothetical protein